jgi:hypothetical protein
MDDVERLKREVDDARRRQADIESARLRYGGVYDPVLKRFVSVDDRPKGGRQ